MMPWNPIAPVPTVYFLNTKSPGKLTTSKSQNAILLQGAQGTLVRSMRHLLHLLVLNMASFSQVCYSFIDRKEAQRGDN